jgi:hypothetical protein
MEKQSSRVSGEPKEEVYISWSSPSRLFKKRDKEYYTNVGAIVFLLAIIFAFAREFVLIATVVSLVFLVYVLATVPPEDIKHKITNLGIESGGHFYRWEELVDFWFEDQWGQTKLEIRAYAQPRLIILLGNESKDTVREAIAKYIPFREVPDKTWVENAATWLSQKVPLEKPV